MKVLKKSMVLEKDELIHTLTENKVLSKCNHQFLTSLHFSFQTDSLLCFVMEYVNGGEVCTCGQAWIMLISMLAVLSPSKREALQRRSSPILRCRDPVCLDMYWVSK